MNTIFLLLVAGLAWILGYACGWRHRGVDQDVHFSISEHSPIGPAKPFVPAHQPGASNFEKEVDDAGWWNGDL